MFPPQTPIRSATELKESFSAFPLAVTELLGARITGIDRLTSDPRVKRAYKVALGIKVSNFHCQFFKFFVRNVDTSA